MNALIEAEFSTNYDADNELFNELNKHLSFNYDKDSNKIFFSVEYEKGGHYVMIATDKDELLDAIKRAVEKPE